MIKNIQSKNAYLASKAATVTKHQQVIDLLSQDSGASLEELSTNANWLPHSTRAFLTGLKKRGFVIVSDKVEGIRRYRATSAPSKSEAK